ncbi:MAG: EAL domain-containing protein [Proteobacteria bacterium]|nr:EAL domain-containing protein [Pseudomonadota bacterium]MDA1355389.1 EAL domain-containing protein [Pseudomonadota bacterium]
MSVLFHGLVALSYIAIAAAAAFGLPLLSTGIEPMLALFAGAAILVVSALGHQSVVQNKRGRYIAHELSAVTSTSAAVQRDLELARNELREIKTRFSDSHPLGVPGADLEANTRSSNEVLGELRLLRTLFSQLTNKKGAEKHAAPVAQKTPRQKTPPPPDDPIMGENFDILEARQTAKVTSEYRASYMDLSSSVHQQPHSGQVEFPDNQNQDFSDALPLGGNAQDILAITRDALERARVSLFLQPIVSLPTRRVEYYEAYSRIQDHAGNFIGPRQYLELAERAGLVGAIDNNLLFRCIQLLRRVRRHNRDYGFFCNVSPHTLRDETFFGQFIEFLSENLELVDDLIFEFSQNDVETHYNEFAENLERMAKLGFSFSMDRVERLDLNFVEIAKRSFH